MSICDFYVTCYLMLLSISTLQHEQPLLATYLILELKSNPLQQYLLTSKLRILTKTTDPAPARL